MENIPGLHKKLSKKFYAFNIGFLAAVIGVLGGMQLLHTVLGLPSLLAIFISYFVVVLGRAFYEQLVIWELPLARISVKNNLFLAVLGSFTMSVFYYFLRAPFGNWAIPLTVILSMKIIGEIKKLLWPSVPGTLPEVLEAYSQKIQKYVWGMYIFFLLVAVGTYWLMKLFGPQSFYYSFAAAVFMGIVFEQLYDFVAVYERKLSMIAVFTIMLIAAFVSAFGSWVVFYLMYFAGFTGKAATICAIIHLRLILPINFLRGQ